MMTEFEIDCMAEAIKQALKSLVFRKVKGEWQTTHGGEYWGFTDPDPGDREVP